MKNKISFQLSFLVTIVTIVLIVSCRKEAIKTNELLVPDLPAQTYTYSNANAHMATLGRVLFYDKHLSANNSIACGTCHIQAFGFSDGKQFSTGVANKPTLRNTPGITNESVNTGLFWDARASSFNDLVLRPVQNHDEMGVIDIEKLPEELNDLGYYNDLFKRVYGNDEITVVKIQECLASFLSALQRPRQSKFDQGPSTNYAQFNALEKEGKDIFFSKGKCSSCHVLNAGWMTTANIGLDMNYADKGIQTNSRESEGVFRVPSLVNIEVTGPYMHDGRFKTLEEVVEHYNSGVKDHPSLSWVLKQAEFDQNGNQISLKPQKLNLSSIEKKALVAFLKTLTDENYFSDQKYGNPFVKK